MNLSQATRDSSSSQPSQPTTSRDFQLLRRTLSSGILKSSKRARRTRLLTIGQQATLRSPSNWCNLWKMPSLMRLASRWSRMGRTQLPDKPLTKSSTTTVWLVECLRQEMTGVTMALHFLTEATTKAKVRAAVTSGSRTSTPTRFQYSLLEVRPVISRARS